MLALKNAAPSLARAFVNGSAVETNLGRPAAHPAHGIGLPNSLYGVVKASSCHLLLSRKNI